MTARAAAIEQDNGSRKPYLHELPSAEPVSEFRDGTDEDLKQRIDALDGEIAARKRNVARECKALEVCEAELAALVAVRNDRAVAQRFNS